jgi:hypothetical protein
MVSGGGKQASQTSVEVVIRGIFINDGSLGLNGANDD